MRVAYPEYVLHIYNLPCYVLHRVRSLHTWLCISFLFPLCILCYTNYVYFNLYILVCICEYTFVLDFMLLVMCYALY
jgi:hypothetical protein